MQTEALQTRSVQHGRFIADTKCTADLHILSGEPKALHFDALEPSAGPQGSCCSPVDSPKVRTPTRVPHALPRTMRTVARQKRSRASRAWLKAGVQLATCAAPAQPSALSRHGAPPKEPAGQGGRWCRRTEHGPQKPAQQLNPRNASSTLVGLEVCLWLRYT